MSMTIQQLPLDLSALIFKNLEIEDLKNVMRVCKTWKQIVEKISNLIIDVKGEFIITKDITLLGSILIRAKKIFSDSNVCLSGKKVTFVAEQIDYLGSIKALTFDSYANKSHVKGPMRGVLLTH